MEIFGYLKYLSYIYPVNNDKKIKVMIRKKIEQEFDIIDLTGSDGNAFYLLGRAKSYAKRLGLDESKILNEMMEGDYEHLVETFDKYFGAFVILER